jgi:hypothetical protein
VPVSSPYCRTFESAAAESKRTLEQADGGRRDATRAQSTTAMVYSLIVSESKMIGDIVGRNQAVHTCDR